MPSSLQPTITLEERLLPAIVRMTLAGVPVDYEAWAEAAKECEAAARVVEGKLREIAPSKPGPTPMWNIDSPAGVKNLLHAIGVDVADTTASTLKHHVSNDMVCWIQSYRRAKRAGNEQERERLRALIAEHAPEPPKVTEEWNFGSPAQVKEIAALLGFNLPSTDALELLRHKDDHEFFVLMMEYRRLSKLASTYGVGWFKDSYRNGRVYPKWWQIGTTTGRMACASPNLQQLPNAGPYRSCVRAPEGRALVIADYSQIELRIAAKVAPDKSMLETFRGGEVDIHTETARILTGKKTPTKLERSKAKVINFGLLYGMREESLPDYALKEYGITISPEEASEFHKKYFQVRKGLKGWHKRVRDEFFQNGRNLTMSTLTGRVRKEIQNFNEVLNHPVQGTGADGLKLALAMLHEDRERYPTAVPIITAHDEIVYECDEGEAEDVKRWVEATMIEAMDGVVNRKPPHVPVEVEARVSRDWGGA